MKLTRRCLAKTGTRPRERSNATDPRDQAALHRARTALPEKQEGVGMKERPIIFNDEMVRAILDGRKTQTRRIMKAQPRNAIAVDDCGFGEFVPVYEEDGRPHGIRGPETMACEYGKPGHRLWVRETFVLTQHNKPVYCADCRDADGYFWSEAAADRSAVKWKSARHMPRWASRITLEITGVRVERLNDLSEEDAIAEGVERPQEGTPICNASLWFRVLWESIFGQGSWGANPWVWVIEFRRVS